MAEGFGVRLSVPGTAPLLLTNLVLDLNGTLALDGRLLPGVAEALEEVAKRMCVTIVTADTFGTAHELSRLPGVTVRTLSPRHPGGPVKEAILRELGAETTAAMGNGANDEALLRAAAFAIGVLGPEGAVPAVLSAADVVVQSPVDGLALLLVPKRATATLRP